LFFDQLGLKEAILSTALDEPVLTIFGSEKIIGMDAKPWYEGR
jgi:hypothetical protein